MTKVTNMIQILLTFCDFAYASAYTRKLLYIYIIKPLKKVGVSNVSRNIHTYILAPRIIGVDKFSYSLPYYALLLARISYKWYSAYTYYINYYYYCYLDRKQTRKQGVSKTYYKKVMYLLLLYLSAHTYIYIIFYIIIIIIVGRIHL